MRLCRIGLGISPSVSRATWLAHGDPSRSAEGRSREGVRLQARSETTPTRRLLASEHRRPLERTDAQPIMWAPKEKRESCFCNRVAAERECEAWFARADPSHLVSVLSRLSAPATPPTLLPSPSLIAISTLSPHPLSPPSLPTLSLHPLSPPSLSRSLSRALSRSLCI